MVCKSGDPNSRLRSTVKQEDDTKRQEQKQDQLSVDSSDEERHQPAAKEQHFSQQLFEDEQQPIPFAQGPPNNDRSSDKEFDEGVC